jgi:hypothetical protein
MYECDRLGMKKFRCSRSSEQIQLAFVLAVNDPKARRSLSSYGKPLYSIIPTMENKSSMCPLSSIREKSKENDTFNCCSFKNWIYAVSLIIGMLQVSFRCTICVAWLLSRIIVYAIFRIYSNGCNTSINQGNAIIIITIYDRHQNSTV